MSAAVRDPVVDFGGGDGGMLDDDWDDLLADIEEGQCTPFLGSGASTPLLPTGSELARALVNQFKLKVDAEAAYLPRITQNISLLGRDSAMRRFIRNLFKSKGRPDFSAPAQLHRVLAKLPLSIYVTTNYDNFLTLALEDANKKPIVELCNWFSRGWDAPDPAANSLSRAADATLNTPLVYHLHGAFTNLRSMVLTEDDYLDFLTVTSVSKSLVPSNVESSFAEKTLLFLGYSLEDMTFKVLLRRISSTIRRFDKPHLTVQLPPHSVPLTEEDEQKIKIKKAYVHKLLGNNARLYWGSCDKFAAELADRWNKYSTR